MSANAPIHQAYRFVSRSDARSGGVPCRPRRGASRFWFNQGLALVKDRLQQRDDGHDADVPWSYKSLCVAFRGDAVKDRLAPWRGEVVTGSYQAGLEALGTALQNFERAAPPGGATSGSRVFEPRAAATRQSSSNGRASPITDTSPSTGALGR